MAISVMFTPEGMTKEQYDEIMRQLYAAGALPGAPGLISHICYGSDDNLCVHDTWESQEHFMEFGKTLLPIIQSVGVKTDMPRIQAVHNSLL